MKKFLLVVGMLALSSSVYAAGDLIVNGNLGVGTTSPSTKLQVGNTGAGDAATKAIVETSLAVVQTGGRKGVYIYCDATSQTIAAYDYATGSHLNLKLTPDAQQGRVGIGMTATRKLSVNGDAGGATSWYNDSDERLKKNIKTIDHALQKVLNLRGVNFEWKNTQNHPVGLQMGLIAQETLKVVPEVVSKPGEYYSVATADLVGLLVEAIKEQQIIIGNLQETIKKQNERIAILESKTK